MKSNNVEFLRYCGGHFENFYDIGQSFMKFCPVVPEIFRGQVHCPWKERKEEEENNNNNNKKKKRSKNNSIQTLFGRLKNLSTVYVQ